jgi:hypothetical protein
MPIGNNPWGSILGCLETNMELNGWWILTQSITDKNNIQKWNQKIKSQLPTPYPMKSTNPVLQKIIFLF